MIKATKIKELKGIGEKTEKLFAKIGIETVGDLIKYYPKGYDVYETSKSKKENISSRFFLRNNYSRKQRFARPGCASSR